MKNRKEGAALRGQLQRIGILRPSGHEHFNGSLVIPVIDDEGQVTEVYGRKLNDNLRKGTPLHLYLPGPHAGVWNTAALKASPEVILTESLIDALTFWCAGFRNVTASYGVEGFTDDHLAVFKAYNTQRVLIAYDRDAAGEAAAGKLSKRLIAEGIDAYRIHFPKGMDANEYACQVSPATKSLGVVIRSALWLGKGKAKPITTEAIAAEASVLPLAAETSSMPDDSDDAPTATDDEPAEPTPATEPPAAPLSAAVIPAAPQPPVEAAVTDTDIVITLGDRRYRLRGLEKNLSFDVMKVNLLVSGHARGEPAVHVDTLDLYQSRPRAAFIRQAAVELGVEEAVIKADVGKLLKCEVLQEERIRGLQSQERETVTLSESETAAALDLLRSPDLLDRIAHDLTRCGLVGEDANKQVAYLAALSRKLDKPLAVTIPVDLGSRQVGTDGGGAGLPATGRPDPVLGDDGAVAVLHGRDRAPAQGPRLGRGRRRLQCGLCAETAAIGRRADDRLDRQGPGDRQARDAPIPRRRPGDADADDHGDRSG